jgi:hypothetical protein
LSGLSDPARQFRLSRLPRTLLVREDFPLVLVSPAVLNRSVALFNYLRKLRAKDLTDFVHLGARPGSLRIASPGVVVDDLVEALASTPPSSDMLPLNHSCRSGRSLAVNRRKLSAVVIGSNLAGKRAGNATSNPEKEFAEPVPLSSTPPIDFRLPPTTCR